MRPSWAETPTHEPIAVPAAASTHSARLRSAVPQTLGLCSAALFTLLRGHRYLSMLLVVIVMVVVGFALVQPSAFARARASADRVGEVVGRWLSLLLLGLVAVLVVAPAWVLCRVGALDALGADATLDGRWQSRSASQRHRRGFGVEPARSRRRGRRVVRLAVVSGLIAVTAVPVWHRLSTRSSAALTPFGPRSTEAPRGVIHRDRWTTYDGIRISRSTFPGEPWAGEMIDELNATPLHEPDARYGWHATERVSRYTNVVDGRRVTLPVVNPDLTVWMFGGSTTFGLGQRDKHTIASELVREARADGHVMEVVNEGVNGYVNWQETLRFEDLLRAGGRPDLVLFLDGINDHAVGFDRETYGLLDTTQPITLAATAELQELRRAQARAIGWTERHDPARQSRLTGEQYRLGVDRARALGAEYGIPVVHFWQPHLVTIPPTSPGVATVSNNLHLDPDWFPHVERQYERDAQRSGVHPIDLTDIFDDADQPLFFDSGHTNEAGARIEAAAIYGHIEPLVQRVVRDRLGASASDPRRD